MEKKNGMFHIQRLCRAVHGRYPTNEVSSVATTAEQKIADDYPRGGLFDTIFLRRSRSDVLNGDFDFVSRSTFSRTGFEFMPGNEAVC